MPDFGALRAGFAGRSDPGRDPEKRVNEDSFTVVAVGGSLVAVVCDGMGGHSDGSLASRTAVDTITRELAALAKDIPARDRLGRAIARASADVYRIGGDGPREERPGATCVALWLHRNVIDVGHVGDSRCYRWRRGELAALTRDHSVIEAWIQAGQVAREHAMQHPDAHRITRALGMQPTVDVELLPTEPLQVGDRFLLCSDGLTDLVNVPELAEQLGSSASLERIAQSLVDMANERGGHDNVTAVVLEVSSSNVVQSGTLSLDSSATQDAFDAASASGSMAGAVILTEVTPLSSTPNTGRPNPTPDRTVAMDSPDRTVMMGQALPPPTVRGPSAPREPTQPFARATVVDQARPAWPRTDRPSLRPSALGKPRQLWIAVGICFLLILTAMLIGFFRRASH